MIERDITAELNLLLSEYPIVTILGPRQAGKTTLTQTLNGYQYCNLENPETRQFAIDDPKAFLAQYKDRKVILDEIQRAPELLSYIQVIVDEQQSNGQFVLTGSHQLSLHQAITQSLAGRTSILTLLPLSIAELKKGKIQFDQFEDYAFRGFLPRIHSQQQRPSTAYSNYFQTYVERDVRQLINLKDLSLFEKFIKLLAGRVGQLMDHSSLANDVGVSPSSIRQWLSILEASYIIYKLPPYFENFGKRAIKSPKYYFIDVGLLTYLLGIEAAHQISRDPLVGQIFENMVVIECLKSQANQGKQPNLYFYRDSNSNELDILLPAGQQLTAIEVKSASTYNPSLLKSLKRAAHLSDKIQQRYLIYSGDELGFSDGIKAISYKQVDEVF